MTCTSRYMLVLGLTLVATASSGCFKGGNDVADTSTGTTTATGTGTGTDTGDTCPEGSESCPCLPDGACDDGLTCVGSGICSPTAAETDTGGAVCGDELVDEGEDCDDGAANGDDQLCTASCQEAICGDGLVLAGVEDCDSGVQSAECDQDCTLPACGDGVVNALAGETCDDGNLDPADDCTDQCLLASCGDGIVNDNEECDDGNVDPDDDCTPDCKSLWWAEGPQINVDQDNLVGWELCWSGLYGGISGPLLDILGEECTKDKLLVACRPVAASELTLLAMGERSAVTFNTGTGNVPYNHNGVGWYYSTTYSWGFALEGDPLQRSSCDVSNVNEQFRMCWHTTNDTIMGGYRCGESKGLNADNTWTRMVFQAD